MAYTHVASFNKSGRYITGGTETGIWTCDIGVSPDCISQYNSLSSADKRKLLSAVEKQFNTIWTNSNTRHVFIYTLDLIGGDVIYKAQNGSWSAGGWGDTQKTGRFTTEAVEQKALLEQKAREGKTLFDQGVSAANRGHSATNDQEKLDNYKKAVDLYGQALRKFSGASWDATAREYTNNETRQIRALEQKAREGKTLFDQGVSAANRGHSATNDQEKLDNYKKAVDLYGQALRKFSGASWNATARDYIRNEARQIETLEQRIAEQTILNELEKLFTDHLNKGLEE
jgi:tetratricopeptide (TPR) repeat protein